MNKAKLRILYTALALIAGVYACSEATDGLPQYDVVITPGTSADGGNGENVTDEAPTETGKPPKQFDAATVTTGVVVLNELGVGDEWIEIVNSGDGEIDLSGWKVADRDKDTGEAKLEEAMTFPDGTTLKPNGYLVVKGGGIDGGKPCPGTAPCFHADWGISNKNGETIFLLASDGGVQGTVVYPPDAANGDDISWGRLPSGDPKGTFAITPSTPGAANQN